MSKKESKIIDLPDKDKRPYHQVQGQYSPRHFAADLMEQAPHQCLKANDTCDTGNPDVRALDDLTALLDSILAGNTPKDDANLEKKLAAFRQVDRRRTCIKDKGLKPAKTIELDKFR